MSKLHIIADRWNLTHRGLFVVGSQLNVPPSIREFYYTAASSYTRSVYNNSTSCAATGMYSSDIKHAAQVISEFGHSVSVEVNNSVVLYIDGVPYVNPNTKITSTSVTVWTVFNNRLVQCVRVGKTIRNTIELTDLFGNTSNHVEVIKQSVSPHLKHSVFLTQTGYSIGCEYTTFDNCGNQLDEFVSYQLSEYSCTINQKCGQEKFSSINSNTEILGISQNGSKTSHLRHFFNLRYK